MIPTGDKKKKTGSGWNGVETLHHPFYPLQPFLPVSILNLIILFIRSEEILLFLVLLIRINTHNRMEINL